MPLRRIVVLALVAGAAAAFLGALLRPRTRPHMLATREEVEALAHGSINGGPVLVGAHGAGSEG